MRTPRRREQKDGAGKLRDAVELLLTTLKGRETVQAVGERRGILD